MVNGKCYAKICILPKVKETGLILIHFLPREKIITITGFPSIFKTCSSLSFAASCQRDAKRRYFLLLLPQASVNGYQR